MADREFPSIISGDDLQEGDIFTPFRKVGDSLSPAPTTFTFHKDVSFGDIDKVLLLDEERRSKWPPESAKIILLHRGFENGSNIPYDSIGTRRDSGEYAFAGSNGWSYWVSPEDSDSSIDEWEPVVVIPERLFNPLAECRADWEVAPSGSEGEADIASAAFRNIGVIQNYLDEQDEAKGE